jgi:Family of unknown function (DUF6328)
MAARGTDDQSPEREVLPLSKAAQLLLEECRMVLPGLQALFGFQLMAVFNSRFAEALGRGEQRLHLVALVLSAVAVALIMAPAAIHRQHGPRQVSETFLKVSTRLLLVSMLPLALSLCLDSYVVAFVILGSRRVALGLSAGLFATFVLLWLVVPRTRRLLHALGGGPI